jgi:dienelactone hydrolase
LAADADGALEAARRAQGIDPRRVGFLGTSQAGWVVPLAVARDPHHVAFTALVDAPAVTTNEEHQWSDLAGEEAEHPRPLTPAKMTEIERKLRPSGFDPVPLLRQMAVPGVWLYGGQDRSQPANRSAARLRRLRTSKGVDFTIVVFPRADHGLLDTPPTDARAMPTVLAWLRDHA